MSIFGAKIGILKIWDPERKKQGISKVSKIEFSRHEKKAIFGANFEIILQKKIIPIFGAKISENNPELLKIGKLKWQ